MSETHTTSELIALVAAEMRLITAKDPEEGVFDPEYAELAEALADLVSKPMNVADIVLATIEIYERECPADDFDTENGVGVPEIIEPEPVATSTITALYLAHSNATLDELVQRELDNFGCGQWDGGITGYDPDGTLMGTDGTMTERWGKITYAEGLA